MLEFKFIVINISIPTKPYAGIFSHPPLSVEAWAPTPPSKPLHPPSPPQFAPPPTYRSDGSCA